jgi:hypothetical protein
MYSSSAALDAEVVIGIDVGSLVRGFHLSASL